MCTPYGILVRLVAHLAQILLLLALIEPRVTNLDRGNAGCLERTYLLPLFGECYGRLCYMFLQLAVAPSLTVRVSKKLLSFPCSVRGRSNHSLDNRKRKLD